MANLDEKMLGFLQISCTITTTYQIIFSIFYLHLPIWPQLLFASLIPVAILTTFLATRKKNKSAIFLFLFFLFAHQTFTFLFFGQSHHINLGAVLMLGTVCVICHVLLGFVWGSLATVSTSVVFLSKLYLGAIFPTFINFPEQSPPNLLYTFLSVSQPVFILNYLCYRFYHALLEEEKSKTEINHRLQKIVENGAEAVVLIGMDKKVFYADAKSKKLAFNFLNIELIEGDDSEKYILEPLKKGFNENLALAFKGERIVVERKAEIPGKFSLWLSVTYSPLYNTKGKIDLVQFSMIDITSLKNARDELEKSEQRWKFALNSSKDGVWDWNLTDNTIYFSPMWKEMLGYKDEEIKNTFSEWEKMMHPDDKKKAEEEIVKHMTKQTDYYLLEHRLRQKNGQYKWILARGKIIERDNDGKPLRFIGTHTDIDPIKKVEEELIAAQEKAEKAAEAKSQFLSTMSHEIRTPINAVIGYSNILMINSSAVLNKEYLENIHISANHLLSLVNNILEISKIESGKITFENREINLEKLVEENLSMISLAATEKGLLLKKGTIPALTKYLIGDPLRLRQVLSNLLGNAVKFTEKGFVELSVDIMEETAEYIILKFSVTDSGIGISPEKIESIFERFTQASTDTTRKYGGTGLGLTISKRIVNLLGGNLGVKSNLDKGSMFYFNLKFYKGAPIKKEEITDNTKNETPLTGLKALVVEDYILNTKIITTFLEMWGVVHAVAENGQEALNLMQKENFDAILMDLHMPVMDGYEATRQIRESGNPVHIMALTANDDFNSEKELKEKGFDSFTLKPIDTKELYKKLKALLLKKNSSTNKD